MTDLRMREGRMMPLGRTLRVAVSGSFHRHMAQIAGAVRECDDLGMKVLSPADPRVVDSFGAFLFVASDRVRTIKPVQSRHLSAIASADFLWLVAPDGYVGQSAAMELGFAVARRVPIFSVSLPSDLTLRQYVTPVESLFAAGVRAPSRREPADSESVLLEPVEATESAHEHLEIVRTNLTRDSGDWTRVVAAATQVRQLLDVE